jgi:arsenate reductase (glutaredoxin)
VDAAVPELASYSTEGSMAKSDFTIYHNPRCSKSRATLALLQEHGIEPQVIEYLTDPPSKAELTSLAAKLGLTSAQLVRKGEEVYKSKYAGRTLSDSQWLQALHEDPILIERPIVVRGARAVLGRPPENVIELLK